jgi:hypothetical protein
MGRPKSPATKPYDTLIVAGGDVADLQVERARRLARGLGIGPTVATPCTDTCWCFGAPLGGTA